MINRTRCLCHIIGWEKGHGRRWWRWGDRAFRHLGTLRIFYFPNLTV